MVIYLDAEHALDEEHALRHGINADPDRFRLLRPPSGEVACEYAESLIMVPEVAIMVIDTLADLVPETEMQKGYFDPFSRNLRARLIARLSRQMTHKVDRPDRPRFLIFVNHLLPNQASAYGGDTSPGGEEQAYASSTIIKLWARQPKRFMFNKAAKSAEDAEDAEAEAEPQKKREINFLLTHHKSRPQAAGAFDLAVEEEPGLTYGDAHDFDAVFNWALKGGLIGVNGKSQWAYDGQMFKAQKHIKDLWKSDAVKYEQVKTAIIAARRYDNGHHARMAHQP